MKRRNVKQHLRRALFVLLTTGPLLILPSSDASSPMNVTGSWTVCAQIDSVTPIGQNGLQIVSTLILNISGPVHGCYVGTEQLELHGDTATFHGSGTFTGSAPDPSHTLRTGTAAMIYTGTLSLSPGHPESANFVMNQGTGGLAGFQAEGTIQGNETCGPLEGSGECFPPTESCGTTTIPCQSTTVGTYNAQIHFAQ
jgi:hypothetical protein